MFSRPHAKPTANNNLSVLEAYILVYQFSHIVCMMTPSNRNKKFSNPPTHSSLHHPEYLGQPDSYGDIPGHAVFSFLDLRVLLTLKSAFVLLIVKIQRKWSEKPMGNTIQFVPSLLSAVIYIYLYICKNT